MDESEEPPHAAGWADVAKLLATAVALTALVAGVYAGSRHWHWSRGGTTALFCVAVAIVYYVGKRI